MGLAVADDKFPGLVGTFGLAKQEDDLVGLAWSYPQFGHDRGTRIAEFTGAVGESFTGEGGRGRCRPFATEELGAIGGERARSTAYVGEGDTAGELSPPGGRRQQRARVPV